MGMGMQHKIADADQVNNDNIILNFNKMCSQTANDAKLCSSTGVFSSSANSSSRNSLIYLIVRGKYDKALVRCRTHPDEVSRYYQIDGAMKNLRFTMLHYMLCDVGRQDMGDDRYQLIKAMLKINPNLPSFKCKPNSDEDTTTPGDDTVTSSSTINDTQEVDNAAGFTPLHCLIYALFGGLSLVIKGVASSNSKSKYLAKILSLMLKVNPQAATIPNQFGLLPLHIVISCCRYSRSLIKKNSKRFKKCFKKVLDAYPKACSQRVLIHSSNSRSRGAGCLPLHLLCMNAATFGEASHFAASLILNENPDAVSQRSDNKDEMFPLHYLCTSVAATSGPSISDNNHRNALDANLFGLMMRSSPISVIFGKDANGKTPMDILLASGHFASATPYILQMLQPHAILERLMMVR